MNPVLHLPLRRRARAALFVATLLSLAGSTSLLVAAPHCHYQIAGGTVLDTETGLLWQQSINSTHYDAAGAASYCSGLGLAGGGFRLPTVAELHTIVDVTATGPTIDAEAFPNTPTDAFWSSTPDAAGTGKVWAVNFADGTANLGAAGLSFYARCVK